MGEELEVLLTGNPGTEDIIAREALEELYSTEVVETRSRHGRVIVKVPRRFLERVYAMRSIHSAVLLILRASGVSGSARGLDEIRKLVAESGICSMLPGGSYFAVRALRAGDHEYHSTDIARVVGDAILNSHGCSEANIGVRLNSPSVVVEAHLIEDTFMLGISLSGGRSLHRRGVRIYDHPAALKPTLAYVMLRLAGARDGDTIADPMCGGGTVAIEAAWTFIASKIFCSDKNPKHIEGAKMNALAARVSGRIEFLVGDARRLHNLVGTESLDVVVTNPPYGIRLGSPSAVRRLYRDFIESLRLALASGGRAAIITTEGEYLSGLARSVGFEVVHSRRVRHGDLWASILVIHKP